MEKQVRLYRPSNGTEGEAFIYNWCRPTAPDICGYCKKEMNDDTVIPIYGQENMDEVNARIKILDIFKPNPNTNG